MLTCANHGDGGLYINPLVRIDARVDEYKTVKVGLLYSTQCILDGVIILQEEGTNTFRQNTHAHNSSDGSWGENKQVFTLAVLCINVSAMASEINPEGFLFGYDLPACSLCLCICRGYCRNAPQSRVLREHLYTATQKTHRG